MVPVDKTRTYRVVPRLQNHWFTAPTIVYDVAMDYFEWYDPSYGNGGGEDRAARKFLATFLTQSAARNAVDKLSYSYSVRESK